MDFNLGGRRLYAMIGPEGEEHWAIQAYTSISPKDNFQFDDAFTDKEGSIDDNMPISKWNLDFYEVDGVTTVKITIKHENLKDLEMQVKMGFMEGFTATLSKLAELLKS